MSISRESVRLATDPVSKDPRDRVDLLGIVALFTAEWRTGLVAALIAFVIASVVIIRIPSQYEATAVILPKDQSSSGSSSNIAAFFTGSKPSNNYVSLLVSRTLRDDVIRRADLMNYFQYRSQEAARGRLFGMTRIFTSDTVAILVRDRNAQMAARIANAYVAALRSLQESMATTQGDLQRRYFEQQLDREKAALAAAEQDLATTQVGLGIVQAETQTNIGLGAIAGIRSEITSLRVRLAVLLQSSTEQNPEVQNLRSQIEQLQVQERRLENGGAATGVGAAPAAGKMPRVNLEYSRKLREVHYHEALVSSLANHYENLRLAASGSNDTFDVIDPAIVPEFPTWPPRQFFFLLSAAGSLVFGLIVIAMHLLVRRVLADPMQRSYLYTIRQNFRWVR